MKKILLLSMLAVLVSCGETKCDAPVAGSTSSVENENQKKTENQEKTENQQKSEKSTSASKGGEMVITASDNGEEEIHIISAVERISEESNSYLKYEMEKRLNDGEKYYFLTVKVKNGGQIPIRNLSPEFLQIETEDGVLYKNIIDYVNSGDVSAINDSVSIDDIPIGTSREIKLNYKIKGEPKSLDYVVNGEIIGKLMLK